MNTDKRHINNLRPLLDKYQIPEPEIGSDCRPEWVPYLDKMFAELIAAGWDRQLGQIKQKFSECRIYLSYGAPKELLAIARRTEIVITALMQE
jgi:hypothetical protein